MDRVLDEIRWGIIGCGNVTEVKSGPAFNKIAGSRLAAVMRRDRERARDYARRHRVPKWYDDADKLISDPEVNAVYIATPPDTHKEYTLRVAAAGKPVYVEKPMARTFAECREMIWACAQAAAPLFVAYYRRRLPAFLKVKELIETGAIGEPRLASIQLILPPRQEDRDPKNLPWRVKPDIAGAGYFYDLASHQLDVLDYIFGPIVSAKGAAANQAGWYPAEDIVAAHFLFKSGVMGSGVWCFTAAENAKTDQIAIVGSKGKIHFGTFTHEPVRLHTAAGVEEFHLPPPAHIQQPLIQTIVDELLGKGKCPSTGVTAARTNWVMEEILSQ
jgi:predicted dehydrogenase